MEYVAERCNTVKLYTSLLKKIESQNIVSRANKRVIILFRISVCTKHPEIAQEVEYICSLFLDKHYRSPRAVIELY